MGEYFVLVRVIGNPVAAEILEAETVGLRGIPEDLGGIVARRVGEDVPDDLIRKGVDAGDEGGGHRMLDFGCFCLLLYFMCSVSRGRILNQFLIHSHFSLSMRFGRVKSGEKRVITLPFAAVGCVELFVKLFVEGDELYTNSIRTLYMIYGEVVGV